MIGIGNLSGFIYVIEPPDLEVEFGEANRYLRRIRQISGEVFWPPATAATDDDAGALYMFLRTTRILVGWE